jgi:RNA polymerase sigma factor (TIGR02999 family)
METPSSGASPPLHALHGADRVDQLLPALYDELRALARAQLDGRPAGTLQPAALVHEAYVRLGRSDGIAANRARFLALAASAMRQVAVDHARSDPTPQRSAPAVTLTDHAVALELKTDELLALDEALRMLDARQRSIVECRFFAGMEEREIADALGLTDQTVRREWVHARAWLYSRLYPETIG